MKWGKTSEIKAITNGYPQELIRAIRNRSEMFVHHRKRNRGESIVNGELTLSFNIYAVCWGTHGETPLEGRRTLNKKASALYQVNHVLDPKRQTHVAFNIITRL